MRPLGVKKVQMCPFEGCTPVVPLKVQLFKKNNSDSVWRETEEQDCTLDWWGSNYVLHLMQLQASDFFVFDFHRKQVNICFQLGLMQGHH